MLRPDRTEALHYEILLIKVRYGLLEPESMSNNTDLMCRSSSINFTFCTAEVITPVTRL